MAILVVNGAQLPALSRRIVEKLQRGTLGYEALMGWTGSTHQSVAKELHKLKAKGLVEHDGRRPRTWKLREPEGTAAPEAPEPMLLSRDLQTRSYAQNNGMRKFSPGFLPPDLYAATAAKKKEVA